MVQGRFKSGRFRKVQRKVPGGQTKTRYLEARPKQARSEHGELLHGIPRLTATEARNAPKTVKRPQRPYGGVLGTKATRAKLKEDARALDSKSGEPKGALYEIGRVCLKIAGRDAGKRCVIVDVEKDRTLLIDGETRRRKCSYKHLEPLNELLDVKKGASHDEVKKAFAGIKIELSDSKPKKAADKPRRMPTKRAKPVKEAPKKAAPKTEAKPKEAPKAETPKPAEKLKVEEKKVEKPAAKLPTPEKVEKAEKPVEKAASPKPTPKTE